MKHTLFAIAAVLLFSAAMLSLAGWAAKRPMRKYADEQLMEASTLPAPRPRPLRRRSRLAAVRPHRPRALLAARASCSARSPRAIVVYMLVQGIKYVRPNLLFTHPRAGFNETETGGFLDPLLGTVIVAGIALAIALPLGVGDRRLAQRVRPPVRAGAGRRVGRRDDRGHAVASCSRCSGR